MKNCHEIGELIKKLQTDSITEFQYKELKDHINQCADCEVLFSSHELLGSMEINNKNPEESEFRRMRASVLRTVRIKKIKKQSWITIQFENLKDLMMRPEMAAAALTLILGFFLGRALPPEKDNLTQNIISQVSKFASGTNQIKDFDNLPYEYSNVSFKEVDEKNIALSFDVSTHLDLVRPKNDAMVKDVIARALLNPTNEGTRLKAISYSENVIDQKIKEALIFSMHNAPMLTVRLQAMKSLMNHKNDAEIIDAFLKTLKTEESVKMRLMAMDYFEDTKINPDTLEATLRNATNKQSTAVWIKAKKYIDNE